MFSYTVAENDEDTNGIAITADSLTLNSGTIKEGTTDAALPHDAVAADPTHKVDGVRPTVVSAVIAAAALDEIVITFSETLSSTTPAAAAFTVTVDMGTAPGVSTVSASGATVTLTLASEVTDEQTVTVNYKDPTDGNDTNAIQDVAGNGAESFTRVVTEPGVTPAIAIDSKTIVNVAEDREAAIDVKLGSAPSTAVTVNVVNNKPEKVTVSPASFTFTPLNWQVAQTLDIIPVEDSDTDDETVTLTLSGTGVMPKTVTVIVGDVDASDPQGNQPPRVTVDQPSEVVVSGGVPVHVGRHGHRPGWRGPGADVQVDEQWRRNLRRGLRP